MYSGAALGLVPNPVIIELNEINIDNPFKLSEGNVKH